MPMVSGLSSQKGMVSSRISLLNRYCLQQFFCLFPDDSSMWWDCVRAINIISCSAGLIRVLIARTYPPGRMYEKKKNII
jgi:hypothetical protein